MGPMLIFTRRSVYYLTLEVFPGGDCLRSPNGEARLTSAWSLVFREAVGNTDPSRAARSTDQCDLTLPAFDHYIAP
jgi:hypothetical protein